MRARCLSPQQGKFTQCKGLCTQDYTVFILLFSTNIAYNLKNNCIFPIPFTSRVPLEFFAHEKVYLLGKFYDQHKRDQFYNDFEKVIWFSYRRLSHCSDVGWGCMIRVVQMMVAQAITRDQPQMQPNSVLDWFRE